MKTTNRNHGIRGARPLTKSFSWIALSALAVAQTGELKTPRSLPNQADEKTLPQTVEKGAPRIHAEESSDVGGQVGDALERRPKSASAGDRTPSIDLDQVWFDAPGDGSLWALGASYKAQFASERVTYIPFLGSNAPRNFPVAFDVESVTIDGQALTFDAHANATRSARTVTYDRGSFVELYELQPASMEQLFVFDTLPERGEIVVHVGVETLLARSERVEGFDFSNEHGTGAHPCATALDA